jgi:hypothetical protein
MTGTLQRKEHFKRIGNARIYLQEKGFVFMGAPDRWKLIGEDAISYAQIAQGPSDFVIIFSSLIRETGVSSPSARGLSRRARERAVGGR